MAQSTCPKCDNHYFEVVENTPRNSNFKLFFVQCTKCGAVVGTQEYAHIGNLIMKLAKKLNIDLDR